MKHHVASALVLCSPDAPFRDSSSQRPASMLRGARPHEEATCRCCGQPFQLSPALSHPSLNGRYMNK